ncbi:MAG: hypothetical protein JXM71_07575, partial [Spirochaetales bacterium]|nr:hypothetical protein [Spirochaetales bacterium]
PPRWSLGYLGSGMGYTDSPDPVSRLWDFVRECDTHRIPCDMFHMSSGYSMSDGGERWVFAWNRNRIPDPSAVAATFHAGGMKVCANIKPCLLLSHPEYGEAARTGVFIGEAQKPALAKFWGGNGSYIDFTSVRGYDWWKSHVRERLLDYGVDATWNDNNEYEIWDDTLQCDGFGAPVPLYLARPLHSLLMARASREAQTEHDPERRPYLLTRSGCPGIQRYAQTWTGDNSTSWNTLRYNIPMGLGMGLSGMAGTGHDVGGFWGAAPSPELFVRWVQNGIFQPRFSIHSWRNDGTASEPWMYPETLDIVRAAIEFRLRLLPYLYNLYCQAAQEGDPITRPLVYEFADDPRCLRESFEFMLGPWLLVVPVLEEGARETEVYLPAGTRWCDFDTGRWYDGGTVVTVPTPIERPTILARAGAIIPTGKVWRRIDDGPDDTRELYVFPNPGGGDSAYQLVEDDGATIGYQRGERSVVAVTMTSGAASIDIGLRLAESGYKLPYADISLILPFGEARQVSTKGFTEAGSDYAGRRRLVCRVADQTRH